MSQTTEFDPQARGRIVYAIVDAAPSFAGDSFNPPAQVFLGIIRAILLREWGRPTLAGLQDPVQDVQVSLTQQADTGGVLDIIEAVFEALDRSLEDLPPYARLGHEDREAPEFRRRLNEILDDGDIAYQVVGREIVPRDSMAMYADVIAPALSLLHGQARLANVERAFLDALRELKPGGNPADAITDAGTALQEMLRALGAQGNALGPLLESSRRMELLGPYDSKLAEGVELIGHWVSADRSMRGDAHSVTESNADDAWLAVHVVGALILRLEKRFHGE